MDLCCARPARNPGHFFRLLAIVTLLLGLPGMAAAAPPDAASKKPAPDDEYIIGVGDILSIQVWREPELTKTLTVRNDGRISMPLVGEVKADGKTIKELTSFLSEEFGKVITAPAVSVTLVENRSKRYYLEGQVQQPGEFLIDHPITVLQAIARGGGFLEWAKKDKIAVIRRVAGQEQRLSFDYDSFVEGKKQQDILISPGDTIIVP
ncbi:MAG: polysaccharide biosynthesis/export family protein [Desulfobacteraceae bacterium]|nr:polysaccharide biosynthesis/export family protein [Desulfobacteraceae bacterium]